MSQKHRLDSAPDDLQNGLITELGELAPGSVIDQGELARIFHRHPTSIQRAIERGELPPPVRLLGKPRWTVGFLLTHLEKRLDTESVKDKKEVARIARLG